MDCRLPISESLGSIIPVAIVGFLLFVIVLVMLVLIYKKLVSLSNKNNQTSERYEPDIKYIDDLMDKNKLTETPSEPNKLETLAEDTDDDDDESQVESEEPN